MNHRDGRRFLFLPLEIGFRELILALYLSAGYFKADPRLSWLPIDLTLLLGVGVGLLVVRDLLQHNFRIPNAVLLVLPYFVLFLPGVMWMGLDTYAVGKATRFFSLTLLSAVAPLMILRDTKALRRFVGSLTMVGSVMAIDGAISLVQQSGGLVRLTVFGSSSIALGRALGAPLLGVVLGFFEGQLSYVIALPLLGFFGTIMFATGSRGPLLAAVIVTVLVTLATRSLRREGLARLIAVVLVAMVAFEGSQFLAPSAAVTRIVQFFSGQLGDSGATRLEAASLSLDHIKESPLGLGLGGFKADIGLFGDQERQYPHNILLETFLEGGWAAGVYLLWLICVMIGRLWRAAAIGDDIVYRIVLALGLFYMFNALVSGDFNDNRPFFAVLGVGLSLTAFKSLNSSPVSRLDGLG